jgi:hypothetical protein
VCHSTYGVNWGLDVHLMQVPSNELKLIQTM